MACKCFDEVADRMRDRIKERVGDSIAKVAETGFANTVLRFDRGDYCNVMLPFTFRYYKKKKMANWNSARQMLIAALQLTFARSAALNSKVRREGEI